jgi:hypothetical protein
LAVTPAKAGVQFLPLILDFQQQEPGAMNRAPCIVILSESLSDKKSAQMPLAPLALSAAV